MKKIKEPWVFIFIIFCMALFFMFIIFPLSNVLRISLDYEGTTSFRNYYEAFSKSYYRKVFYNSLLMAGISMLGAMTVGFLFAYLVINTNAPGKKIFRFIAMLPLISPPFVVGMAFIMLFGRRGLITNHLLGFLFNIYGWHGLFFVQTLSFFPLAYLFISSSLKLFDPNLGYAAQNLGGNRFHVFRTIEFPLMMPGILGCALLISTSILSDFGNPLLIGGRFDVFATSIYMQATVLMDVETAGVLSLFLLVPTLILFLIQAQYLSKKSFITVTGSTTQIQLKPTNPWVKWPIFISCLIISILVVLLYVAIIVGSFSKVWGVDYSFTWKYIKEAVIGSPGRALRNSLTFASIAAIINSFISVMIAYVLIRKKFFGRGLMDFLSVVLFVIPGTIMGLAYVTTFNVPPLVLTGTPIIIVISMVFRYMPLGIRGGKAALSQISPYLEEASMNLGADSILTMKNIVFPLLKSPFFFALLYTFMKSFTTLSTVIFLVTPRYSVASVYIINMVESGLWGSAAALALFVILICSILLLLIHVILGDKLQLFQL